MALISSRWGPVSETISPPQMGPMGLDDIDEKTQGFGGLDFSGQIEKNPENSKKNMSMP